MSIQLTGLYAICGDGMDVMGLGIIGHRYFKSTFGANKRDGFQRNGILKSSWQSTWHYSSSLARKHYWIEKAVASSCSSLDQSEQAEFTTSTV